MYRRISRGTVDLANAAAVAAVAAVVDGSGGADSRLPGFDQAHGGIDYAGRRLVFVTVRDTETHPRFSRDQLGDFAAQVRATGVTLEPAEVYEAVSG
jgi:hypothetical protein